MLTVIQMISSDGVVSYSSVQAVSFDSENGFQVQAINTGNNSVSFRVSAEMSGNYIFSLYNLNGNKVAVKTAELTAGSQVMQLGQQAAQIRYLYPAW